MKAALVFFLGFLVFAAGVQGRPGSMLAAIIDPSALIEGPVTSTASSTASSGQGAYNGPAPNGATAVKADANGNCPTGYVGPLNGMCYLVKNLQG
jgi:hypothetical protein